MDTPPPKKQCLAQLSPVDYSSDTVSDQCYITALPSELLVAIFAYLSSRDKVYVRLTCQRFRSFLSDPLFWTSITWMDYFPPREEKALRCALQLGRSSLRELSVFGRGSFAMSKYKSVLASCAHLQSIRMIGFTLSHQQVATLLSCTSTTKYLEMTIEEESNQNLIMRMLASSQLASVVIHLFGNSISCILKLFTLWSECGYLPVDTTICIPSDNYLDGTVTWNLSSSTVRIPPCEHKVRFAIGYSSVHAYTKEATMQPFCEIVNDESGFRFSQFNCKMLGLPSHRLFLSRSSIKADQYTSATYAHGCLINGRSISQDLSFLQNITELCLANLHKLSSHHLSIISTSCPHLVRLDLKSCNTSLSNLSGLRNIASCCRDLQGLNLDGIHFHDVEDITTLWEILSGLKHLSYLRFCFCLMSLCATVQQQQSPRPSNSAQPRVSRIIPQLSDTEVLRGFIRKLNTVNALEISRHVSRALTRLAPIMQDHNTILQTMCSFKSVQYLRLVNCLEKSDSLKEIFSAFRLSRVLYSATHSGLCQTLSSNHAHYQNLRKIGLFAGHSVISQTIASALTSSKKLTHIYISATFSSPDAVTILVQGSPNLLEFGVCGKMKCPSLGTRSSLKQFEKRIKSELISKRIKHYITLYIRGSYDGLRAIYDAIELTELSSMWIHCK